MTYTAYRFKFIRFEDGASISRISMPVVAISQEAAIADIEEAYSLKVVSWEVYCV